MEIFIYIRFLDVGRTVIVRNTRLSNSIPRINTLGKFVWLLMRGSISINVWISY